VKNNIIKGLLFIITLIILISFIFSLGSDSSDALDENTQIDCSECELSDTCDKAENSEKNNENSESEEKEENNTESIYTPKEYNTVNSYLVAISCPVGKTSPCEGSGCGNYIDENSDGYCDIVALETSTPAKTTEKSTPENTKTPEPTEEKKTTDESTASPSDENKSKSPESTEESESEECPLSLKNDPYPGKCDLYKDENENKICDLSENSDNDSGNNDGNNNTDDNNETNKDDNNETNKDDSKIKNPQVFLSSLLSKTTLTTKAYNFLTKSNTKAYILIGILTLAGIFMFFRIGNKIRLILLGLSAILFGFFYGPCLCFLGIFQDLSLYPLTQQLPNYILLSLFIIPLAFALFFGRIFCGSACPFGAVQEFIGKIGHAADVKTKKYPSWLKYFKYLNIIIFALVTIIIGSKWFCGYDPFLTFFTFNGNYVSIFLLGFLIASSFAFGRFFCKYICPYGALLGIISKISLFKYKITSNCKSCVVCQNACPVSAVEKGKINHMECIRCGICKEKCPIVKKQKGKDIEKSFKQNSFKRL
jgi:ferredoxin